MRAHYLLGSKPKYIIDNNSTYIYVDPYVATKLVVLYDMKNVSKTKNRKEFTCEKWKPFIIMQGSYNEGEWYYTISKNFVELEHKRTGIKLFNNIWSTHENRRNDTI